VDRAAARKPAHGAKHRRPLLLARVSRGCKPTPRDQVKGRKGDTLHSFCAAKRCGLPGLLYQSAHVRLPILSASDRSATLGARSTITIPEVEMTSFKTRLYSPALITMVTVLAATGAAFRTG
jgi:hypothetical protein